MRTVTNSGCCRRFCCTDFLHPRFLISIFLHIVRISSSSLIESSRRSTQPGSPGKFSCVPGSFVRREANPESERVTLRLPHDLLLQVLLPLVLSLRQLDLLRALADELSKFLRLFRRAFTYRNREGRLPCRRDRTNSGVVSLADSGRGRF